MCDMRELVVIVEDDKLAGEWATAVASSGQRVVFVRKESEPLVGTLCALGAKHCPIRAAFRRTA